MVGSPSMPGDSSPRCFCDPLRSFDSLPSFYHWNEDEEDNGERKDFQEDEKEEEEKIKINGGLEEDEEKIEIFTPRKKSDACGSCEWSSTACFMENAPVSPSPICSPVSYISCSSPMEMFEFSLVPCQRSQCGSRRSNYGRPLVADEGKEREQQQFSRNLYQHKLQSYSLSLRKAMERSGSIARTVASEFERRRHANLRPTRKVMFCDEFDINSSADNRSRDSNVDLELRNMRLPVASEGKRDAYRISYESELTPASEAGYVASHGSGYESSESEGTIDGNNGFPSTYKKDHARCSPQDTARSGKRNILDKLNAWKQAQTDKLLANLKKKEDGIAAWEWKQTNKARNRMRQIENKLEEKRLRSFRKMQKRINQAQKKAEEKKVKERIIYFNKISKLDSVAKKFTSGKLSWLLLFL